MKIRSLLLMILLFCLSVFFCLTGCSKSDTHYNLTAKTDYSHSTMWFDAPNDALAEADIFYIAPTCIWDWRDADGKIYHHMDIDNPEQRSQVDGSIRLAHALFGKYCRFYAPYYRQVTMESWMVAHEETERRYAVAHGDVVQAFDYYRKTRDTAFLREIMPMLEWATEAQQRNLIDGMLPFNGDETYIAGGVVPRQVMYHGSAEATLLFVEGSRRLIRFVREQGLWSAARIGALEHDVDECSERFRDNFCRDGHLYVNNPRRERKVAYPPTRPGVCLYPGHFDYFPETYHFKGCLYFCKDCMTKDHAAVELPEPELFSIPSANLFPIYIGSELFSESEKRAFLDDVIALYERTGKISGQDRILGYDFGMFLYALCETGHPLRDEVYDRMMSLRDGAGAWVEYYVDGRPSGCGCRPWESGINIEAAIRYAR